jgi:hypothetical protein
MPRQLDPIFPDRRKATISRMKAPVNVRVWHEAAYPECPLSGRYRGKSGLCADMPKST